MRLEGWGACPISGLHDRLWDAQSPGKPTCGGSRRVASQRSSPEAGGEQHLAARQKRCVRNNVESPCELPALLCPPSEFTLESAIIFPSSLAPLTSPWPRLRRLLGTLRLAEQGVALSEADFVIPSQGREVTGLPRVGLPSLAAAPRGSDERQRKCCRDNVGASSSVQASRSPSGLVKNRLTERREARVPVTARGTSQRCQTKATLRLHGAPPHV